MTWPQLTVELGIDPTAGTDADAFRLNDATLGVLDVGYLAGERWYNVADRCTALRVKRGRSRQTDSFRAGTATIHLTDTDRLLDPLNLDSPLGSPLAPRRPVRIFAAGPTATYGTDGTTWRAPIFAGWIDDVDVTYQGGAALITVTAVDALGIAAGYRWTASPAAEPVTDRVARILADSDLDAAVTVDLSTDPGDTVAGGTWDNADALAELAKLATVEQGALYAAADGTLRWLTRPDVIAAADSPTTDATITDTPTATTDALIRRWTLATGTALLASTVTADVAGVTRTAHDPTVAAAYLPRTLALPTGLPWNGTAEADAIIAWLLHRYRSPRPRPTGAEVVTSNPARLDGMEAVANLDLLDTVDVTAHLGTTGVAYTWTCYVEGISTTVNPNARDGAHWVTTLDLADTSDLSNLFTLDVDRLDAAALAA